MSRPFGRSAKEEIAAQMKAVAAMAEAKAAALRAFAESIDEVSEEQFEQYFGDKYAGPGSFQQWMEEVEKATTYHKSDTWGFYRALSEAFAEAQRSYAAKEAVAEAEAPEPGSTFAESQSKDR